MIASKGVRYTDPCFYCGRPLTDAAKRGCGSEEFPSQDHVDRLCEIHERARAGERPKA